MSFSPRTLLLLLAWTVPVLLPGLPARVSAQSPASPPPAATATPASPPLLQVEGSLTADDATLNDGSVYDRHEFTGQAEQTVTLLLESEAFDAYLILEDDQGNRIATNDDIRFSDTNAALIVTLPVTGRYRVIANAYRAEMQGPYRLTVQPSPAGVANPLLSAAEVTILEANQRFQEGNARYRRSEFQAALTLWEDALAGYRAEAVRMAFPQDSRQGEANSLGNLGVAYRSLGEYGRAIDFHQQSLEIAQQIGDRRGEANALGNLGTAYYSLGEYGRAIDFLQQHLEIAQQIGDRQGEANALGSLGTAYYALGEYRRAIDFHQQHLEIAQQIGDRRGESNSLHNLGAAFLDQDNWTEAEPYFQRSAHVQESLHTRDLADANRLSLLDSQQVTYRLWQTTLMRQGQPERALEVSERGRAQALAVSMAESLYIETTPPNLARIQAVAREQAATLVEYSVLPSGRILIWVVQPDGTLHATESDAAALDDSLVDTAARFAGLGHNSRGSDPETPLTTLVDDTQAALTTRGGTTDESSAVTRQQMDSHLQQLHSLLIDPIAHWLPDDDQQRVIFIPHRELFRVPFTALKDANGTYLIQQHTILTAPSIQSLELASQHRQRVQAANASDALIVGNPTLPTALQQTYGWQALPGAETEADNVGGYLSQALATTIDVLLHDQATETLVKQRLHTARFIHLATHGSLASASESVDIPGLQYSLIPGVLALAASGADDGSLTADELWAITQDQPLNAELVVLSACQTGQGPITSDGTYGLSRTLLRAGVPTLVASLWNASDYHTVSLMDEFYRQLLVEGEDKAQALRQAMLQMIEQGDDNPQYWAAFTLVGSAE